MLFIDAVTEYEKQIIEEQKNGDGGITPPSFTEMTKYDEVLNTRIEEIVNARMVGVNDDWYILAAAWAEHAYKEYNLPPAECETLLRIAMESMGRIVNTVARQTIETMDYHRSPARKIITKQGPKTRIIEFPTQE